MEAKILNSESEIKKFHESEEDYSSCPPAGFGIRLLSGILDGIIVGILNQITNVVTVFIAFGGDATLGSFNKLPGSWQLAAFAINIFISFMVLLKPLKNSGQTPGKKILKIQVVRENFDTNLSWGQVIRREWLVKPFSVILFFISLPMIIFREDKRVIHDFAVGTRVIRVKEN